MTEIGIGLGYSPELTIHDMANYVVEAEKKGFELAFFSETIIGIRDAITSLATFANRTSKIKLGATQILRLRTPLTIAETFSTLDELSNGRVFLAIGACTESHCKKHGLPFLNPAKVLEEHAILIKKYWSEEFVSFKGETIQVESEGLLVRPKNKIPLLIAATSRTGLKIAGKVGDGVVVNATTSPEYAKNALEIVRKSAEEHGRHFNDFMITGIVVAGIEDGTKEAERAIRWELASKFEPLQVDFAVRPRIKVGEPYVSEELITKLLESYKKGGKEQLARDIPMNVIKGLTAYGSKEEVINKVEEYRKAGVKIPIVRPASSKLVKPLIEALATK
jgi:Coenzyme F420-dependent N5,N10-methylene tetrahydromethanopterin reductase and related flavin-dependent oxidoreductases